jgi:hypothetical protein
VRPPNSKSETSYGWFSNLRHTYNENCLLDDWYVCLSITLAPQSYGRAGYLNLYQKGWLDRDINSGNLLILDQAEEQLSLVVNTEYVNTIVV